MAAVVLLALCQWLPGSRLNVFLSVWPPLLLGALGVLFLFHSAPLPLLVAGRWLERTICWQRRIPTRLFLPFCFCSMAAMCAALSGLLFDHVPHVNDSINQYIHAKFVAGGHVSIPSHPLKEFFGSGWMINDGRWYSPYSPGHVLMLALGHLAGLPWLVNPVLGALTVVAVYFLAEELYGAAVGRLSAALILLCPLIVFMSSTFMNHVTALLCTTLFMLFFLRALRTRHWCDAALSGLSLGILALTRPYTAFAIGLPYALIALWHLYKNFRAHLKPFAVMALVIFSCALFQLWWNVETTGDPFMLAYSKLYGSAAAMPGLGNNPYGAGAGHSLAAGLTTLGDRFVMMNEMLFEWPLPSLMLVALPFICGAARRQDFLLLATYASLALTYAFFIGRSDVFGPRYHYEASAALVILTAAAIVRLPVMLRLTLKLRRRREAIYGVCICLLLALYVLSNVPFRYALYSRDYPEVSYGYYLSIVQNVREPALVFAPGNRSFLSLAFTLPPKETTPVIFAADLGEKNAQLIAYYPCRYAYIRQDEGLLQIHAPAANCR